MVPSIPPFLKESLCEVPKADTEVALGIVW